METQGAQEKPQLLDGTRRQVCKNLSRFAQLPGRPERLPRDGEGTYPRPAIQLWGASRVAGAQARIGSRKAGGARRRRPVSVKWVWALRARNNTSHPALRGVLAHHRKVEGITL